MADVGGRVCGVEEGLHRDLLWSGPWGTKMVPLDDCGSNLCVGFGAHFISLSVPEATDIQVKVSARSFLLREASRLLLSSCWV